MPRPRRLVIRAPNGTNVTTSDGDLFMINLTGMPNADARTPLAAVVEEQCDLLCWHERSSGSDLPLWSD